MTDEEKADRIAALIREREGYERRGMDDRVAAINADLHALGEKAATPAARAAKRPAAKSQKATETR